MITSMPEQIDIQDFSPPRLPGLHLSDLIARRVGKEDAYVNASELTQLEKQERLGNFSQGFLFENVVEPALARMYGVERKDSLVCEGVVLNPDGFDVQNGILWEYKATRKSCAKHIEGRERWMWQIMSYCYALQCTKASLLVLYLSGDYRQRRYPLIYRYDFEFTVAELRNNWLQLISYIRADDKLYTNV